MTDLKQMLEEKPKGRLRAEDLRIGNIVYHPRIDLPIEITWAYLRDLPNLNLQRIQLTDSWLIDFGFKQHPQSSHLYFLNEFRYNLNSFTLKVMRSCDKAGESQRHECGYPVLTDMISCGYVHELQNVHFVLKRTDLKFKQKVG